MDGWKTALVGAAMAVAIAGCAGASDQNGFEKSAVEAASMNQSVEPPDGEVQETLPKDACTPDGYWSFFEAFVRSRAIRRERTSTDLKAKVEPFHIASVDDRWVYSGPSAKGDEPIELNERRDGNRLVVSYDFDPEVDHDDGRSRHRKAEYVFDFVDGCWQLDSIR